MADTLMKVPQSSEEWELIAANFEQLWDFPHCIGAVDGKHVVVKCPDNSGSLYFNYKNTFSIVLMALVDANHQFKAIDVGSFGRNNDAGIFDGSALGQAIRNGSLNFPESRPLPGGEALGPVPYVVVADPAFPLEKHIMRSYPGRGCPEDELVFNYRLSRARRIVENAFGLLAARWRIYHTKIAVNPQFTVDIVKATCLLHNLVQKSSTPMQRINPEETTTPEGLLPIAPRRGNRALTEAKYVRNIFKTYFNDVNPLPWQLNVVRRGTNNSD